MSTGGIRHSDLKVVGDLKVVEVSDLMNKMRYM